MALWSFKTLNLRWSYGITYPHSVNPGILWHCLVIKNTTQSPWRSTAVFFVRDNAKCCRFPQLIDPNHKVCAVVTSFHSSKHINRSHAEMGWFKSLHCTMKSSTKGYPLTSNRTQGPSIWDGSVSSSHSHWIYCKWQNTGSWQILISYKMVMQADLQ